MGKQKDSGKAQPDCGQCDSLCCRYVATQIDTPTCKKDYDHIRWYLLHQKCHVFEDEHGDWFLEVAVRCKALREDGLCDYYEQRPKICRRHGETGENCEFDPTSSPYRRRFSDVTEFEDYLERKGVDWRWKR